MIQVAHLTWEIQMCFKGVLDLATISAPIEGTESWKSQNLESHQLSMGAAYNVCQF